MAPEQVRGLETDGRSDIYALGMMLYEVLTGKLPFETHNEFELMKMQTEQMPVPPRKLNPAIPEKVEEAIMQAVRKDPDERFQTAGEFRDMLFEAGLGTDAVMHGATVSFRRTSPSRPPTSKPGILYGEISPLTVEKSGTETPVAPVIAATRIATVPSAEISTEREIKQTRFVATAQPAAGGSAIETSGSFFSKLGAIHYATAGVIVIFLIGIAVAVPVFLMSGGTSASNTEVKRSNTNTQSERPEVLTPRYESPEPVRSEIPRPTPEPTLEEMAPPKVSQVEKRKDEKTSVAPRTAPAPPKPAAPVPAKPKCTIAQMTQGCK